MTVPVSRVPRRIRRRGTPPRSARRRARMGVRTLIGCLIGLAFIFPFYWTVVISLSRPGGFDSYPPLLLPEWDWANWARAWNEAPWPRLFLNTVFIASCTPSAEAGNYLTALERYLASGVAAARASTDTVEAAALRESSDSWGAALHLATRCYGVSAEVTQAAFIRCRRWMTTPECEIKVVKPLMDALADLRAQARITLVTNSGADGLATLLERLDIMSYFHDIVPEAAKPDGLRRHLQRSLGPDARTRPWRRGRQPRRSRRAARGARPLRRPARCPRSARPA